MRRRLPVPARVRSAALPLHRHSLPQLAIDGAMVAAAYWLAYRLRFDDQRTLPHALRGAVLEHDRLGRRVVRWSSSRSSASTQKQWRYSASATTLAIAAGGRRRAARARRPTSRSSTRCTRPASTGDVDRLGADRRARALLPADARRSSAARASSARVVYERPLRGFRARQRRPPRADRRRRRRRPAGAARDPAQPGARAHARSASSTTTRPSAACASTACKVLGQHRPSSARDPRRGRARRGHHRDPVGAGHAARARRARRAASAASRCARCRPSSSCCRPAAARRAPGARGAGRGRPRPRAGAHGARPRRRAT